MKTADQSKSDNDYSIENNEVDGARANPYFQQMLDQSPVAIYACDAQGYITYYNETAVAIWGRVPVIGADLWCGCWKIYHSDGRPMPLNECPMALTLKTCLAFEHGQITIERPDHTFRNLLVFPVPLFNKENKLIGAHNTLVDITDQQHIEHRQAMLSAIVESSDDAIISKDLNGIIRTWNSAATRIFGYVEKEVIGKSITIIIPENRMNEETLILGKIRAGERVDHFETIRQHKDGTEIPISVTVSPIMDSKGIVVGASKVARDISSQLLAQAEINKHTSNLEILNSISKSISEKMDVDAILQTVTHATTKITGAAFGAFFYNTINDQGEACMLYTLSGASKATFEKFGMPQNNTIFYPAFSEDGVVRVADVTKDPRYWHNSPFFGNPKDHLPVISYLSVPVTSASGEVIGGLFFGHPEPDMFEADHEDLVVNIAVQAAIALDNTKLFEQVKSLSDKKDEFIALASHELKTPMTTIKGYLQILAKTERDKLGKLFLDKSLYQVEKLNNLVDDLLHMSRIEAGKLEFNLEDFDLCLLLKEQAETFRYSCDTHELLTELPESPVFINGDRQRIEQVITNLLSNAVKYSPGAKLVEIKLYVEDSRAILRIKDQGIGLTAEQQGLIFTRFYRAEGTKGISGLGLGLYLTKQVIDRHNGNIKVISVPGKGSEFLIYLHLKETQ